MPDKKQAANKKSKRTYIIIWEYVKTYLQNSGIHGVKYLVEDGRHWSERVFWVIVCSISWIGCGVMTAGAIQEFLTNKSAITIDTTYQKWEVNFPALHFCFSFSEQAKNYAVNITGISMGRAKMTTRFSLWANLGHVEGLDTTVTAEQFQIMGNYATPNCTSVFGVCLWNDEPIDCCKLFFPMISTLGRCLSFNSIHTHQQRGPGLPKFVMNHHRRQAKLTISINNTAWWKGARSFVQMLIVDTVTLPTVLGGREATFSVPWDRSALLFDINQTPTYNDDGVIAMSIPDRHCRLSSEIDGLIVLKAYSYHGCLMEAQMKRSVDLCGCLSHIFPATKLYRMCNSTELDCVGDHKNEIINAVDVNCLPDCEETTIDVFQNSINNNDIPDWAVNKLVFNLLPGPFTRFHRYTVRSIQDVVVSVGSAVGLFIGASVLSLLEIPYWLGIRRNTK